VFSLLVKNHQHGHWRFQIEVKIETHVFKIHIF